MAAGGGALLSQSLDLAWEKDCSGWAPGPHPNPPGVWEVWAGRFKPREGRNGELFLLDPQHGCAGRGSQDLFGPGSHVPDGGAGQPHGPQEEAPNQTETEHKLSHLYDGAATSCDC